MTKPLCRKKWGKSLSYNILLIKRGVKGKNWIYGNYSFCISDKIPNNEEKQIG